MAAKGATAVESLAGVVDGELGIDFWLCHTWPLSELQALASSLVPGDEVDVLSFDNDDGLGGCTSTCALTRWSGVVVAPSAEQAPVVSAGNAVEPQWCHVKFSGVANICLFPDPATMRRYAILVVQIHRRRLPSSTAKRTPVAIEPSSWVPTVIPTRANLPASWSSIRGCMVYCSCQPRAPKGHHCDRKTLAFNRRPIAAMVGKVHTAAVAVVALANHSHDVTLDVVGFVSQMPCLVDGILDRAQLRARECRVLDREVQLDHLDAFTRRGEGPFRYLHHLIAPVARATEPRLRSAVVSGSVVILDLKQCAGNHLIAAVVGTSPFTVPPTSLCCTVVGVAPGAESLLLRQADAIDGGALLVARRGAFVQVQEERCWPLLAAVTLLGDEVLLGRSLNADVIVVPAAPNVLLEAQFLSNGCATGKPTGAVVIARPIVTGGAPPTTIAANDVTSTTEASQSAAGTASEMRGAAKRIGGVLVASGDPAAFGASAATDDTGVGGAVDDAVGPQCAPPAATGSWISSGRSVYLYFHPELSIVTADETAAAAASDGDTAAMVVPVNAVPPSVVSGSRLDVKLMAIWRVPFVDVDVDVVDEDGDLVPAHVLPWSITEYYVDHGAHEVPVTADDAPAAAAAASDEEDESTMQSRKRRRQQPQPPTSAWDNVTRPPPRQPASWRPMSHSIDVAPVRPLAAFKIDLGDLPARDDGVTVRLQLTFVDRDAPCDDPERVLCQLMSHPIIVRSSRVQRVAGKAQAASPATARAQAACDERHDGPQLFHATTAATAPSNVVATRGNGLSVEDDVDDMAHLLQRGRNAASGDVATGESASSAGSVCGAWEAEETRSITESKSDLSSSSASYTYWALDVVPPELSLAKEVFVDPGRCNHLCAVSTESATQFPAGSTPHTIGDPAWLAAIPPRFKSAYLQRRPMVREVVVIDVEKDLRLGAIIEAARLVANGAVDVLARAQALTWFVGTLLGGLAMDETAAELELLSVRKAVDTRRSGNGNGAAADGGIHRRLPRSLNAPPPPSTTNVVALGSVHFGLCRHRAPLLKLLCDVFRVPCFLVRGDYLPVPDGPDRQPSDGDAAAVSLSTTSSARHVWTVVVARGSLWLADPTLDPLSGLQPWPAPRYLAGTHLRLPTNLGKFQDLRLQSALRVTLMEECGSGVSAVVRRCIIGGLSCAIKLPRSDADFEQLYVEMQLMQSLSSCSSIVTVFGWRKGIVMEYMPMSLLAFLNSLTLRRRKLSKRQRVDVLTGVLRALATLHATRYVHRDVKAENILVAVNRCDDCKPIGVYCERCTVYPKLTDFADAVRIAPNTHTHPSCAPVGTVPYAAPEIEAQAPFSFAADMWSVGILAVELQLMDLPREGTAGLKGSYVRHNYFDAPLESPNTSTIFVPRAAKESSKLATLVAQMLDPDWRRRPTAVEGLAALKDEDVDTTSGAN